MTIARRMIVYSAPVSIAAAAIRTWHTTAIEVAPAPGPNRIILPLAWSLQLKAGAHPFGITDVDNQFFSYSLYLDDNHVQNPASPIYVNASSLLSQATDHIEVGGTNTLATISSQVHPGFVTPDLINKPLLLEGDNDLQGGSVAVASLNAAGLLYAPGDTGHIIQGSNTSATYTVLTAGGGGAVATFSIATAGTNYAAATGLDTDTSGAGSGFKVNITTINKGDGSLVAIPVYTILRLS